MTQKLIETIATFVVGAMTMAISVLVYALTSYFISAREHNRYLSQFFKDVMENMENKEKEEQE